MKRLAVALALLFVPSIALADGPPSRWDRAKDPQIIEDYKLHVGAQQTFDRMYDARRSRPERADLAEWYARNLRVSLEAWHADESPDVRLRFDLGRLLEEQSEHGRAIKVLREAIAMAPDHPGVDEAWWYLGIACGHTGETACEEHAYLEILRIRTEDELRLTPMLNLAEVQMHEGRMKDSIASYQETLRVATHLQASRSSITTQILGRYGLAVAYDRAGDRPAAEREAKGAVEMALGVGHPLILHKNSVFFYPSYEVYYYDGLAAVALARSAASAHDAAPLWAEAERKFAQYVRGAEARKDGADRFLGVAKGRQASCKAEREKAEKRRAKEPAPPRDDEEQHL